MPRLKINRKSAALLMLLVLLAIVGNAAYAPQGERYGLTADTAAAGEMCALDQTVPAGSHDDHKPPKHSFIDYDALFATSHAVPEYPPCTSFTPHHRVAALPDVYHDIFVPPQNHA